jgi:hypothetical protein
MNYEVEEIFSENFFKSKSVGFELLNSGLLGRRLIHSTTKLLLIE